MEQQLKQQISKYFSAVRAGLKAANKVRRAEEIHLAAQKYEGNDNWINKFKNGEVVKNKFGAKLYFKFG